MIRGSLRGCGVALALALAFVLAPAPATGGDAAVAKSLFEGGKKALAARKYEEASTLFGKAWVEDPTLLDAIYWKGFAQDKAKDTDGALESFRKYVGLLEKKSADKVTAEEKKLRKTSRDRIRALAVAEEEFQSAEDKYVAALLAIVRKRMEKGESDAALRAARRVLEVAPDNEEALAVRKKLAPDVDPFAEVQDWRLLVEEKAFDNSTCTYDAGVLVVDAKVGGGLKPTPGLRLENGFAFDAVFQVKDAYDPDWGVGAVFGDDGTHFWVAAAKSAKVDLLWGEKGKAPRVVGSAALPAHDLSKPLRLGVIVREGVVLCLLGGEVVLKANAAGMPTDGEGALFMNRCRAAFTSIRFGRLP